MNNINFKTKKKTFIVAEISANHCHRFNKAVMLIKAAKKAGADAVKFQTYTADTLTINENNKYFRIKHTNWRGQTLYQLYQKAYTPLNWLKELKKISDDLGIGFFSTAFDKSAVDFLEVLNVRIHKISSFELIDLPLIEYVAKTKKTLFLSIGMSTLKEVTEAIDVAKRYGANDIVLLKCISSYPARPDQMNLKTIPDLRNRFKLPIGISDHSLGIGCSIAAVALGAIVVEKHFKLSEKENSVDSFFSITPRELRGLVENIRITEKALGEVNYALTTEEVKNKFFRRSLFVVEDIKKGEFFTEDNIRSIRPSSGIRPKYYGKIIGKTAKRSLKRGTPLSWSYIEK